MFTTCFKFLEATVADGHINNVLGKSRLPKLGYFIDEVCNKAKPSKLCGHFNINSASSLLEGMCIHQTKALSLTLEDSSSVSEKLQALPQSLLLLLAFHSELLLV